MAWSVLRRCAVAQCVLPVHVVQRESAPWLRAWWLAAWRMLAGVDLAQHWRFGVLQGVHLVFGLLLALAQAQGLARV